MSKNKFLFSIIVPVYNVEKYVEKSLDSIVAAMDIDCEVIIINDGSTDDCDSIIKEYIETSVPDKFRDNFKYIYKENKGLSDTKNVGIDMARGEFISVVDSDDRITDDFYDTARRYIKQNYDVIIYDLYLDFENGSSWNCVARALKENYDGTLLDKLMMGAMLGSSCNKIIKRDLYKYMFPTGKQYEDVCVTPFILIDAEKIKYIPNPNYIYLQREKSIVSSNTLDGAFYKICSNLSCVLSDLKGYDKYKQIIYVFFLDRTVDMLDLSFKRSHRKFLKNICNFYNENVNVINYIVENDLLKKYKMHFSSNQFKILNIIYNSLYNKKFRKVKLVLFFRRVINYFRNILRCLKKLIIVIFGGAYE